MRILLLAILVTMVGMCGAPVSAQTTAGAFLDANQGIELTPTHPRPGETITATLATFGSNAFGSQITWLINDQVIPDAENQRTITLTAGPAGVPQAITAILTNANGLRSTLTNTITPVYLDIIVEPQTRTPAFYLGRSLPSIGSTVNATALISGEGFRNPDLVYTWRLNQAVLEGGPIRGRNQVSFTTPMGTTMTLSVQVTTPNGTVLASRAILLPSVRPEIHFYEVSSLFGINQTPITSALSLIGNSTTVRAEPYYLDSRVYNNPSILEWEVNGTQSSTPTPDPYQATLQRLSNDGQTELNFHVRDYDTVLQGAEESVTINF